MDQIKFIKFVLPNYLTSHSEPQNIKKYINLKYKKNIEESRRRYKKICHKEIKRDLKVRDL